MNEAMPAHLDSRRQRAIAELRDAISARYPSATFALRPGIDDPGATYIIATVDVEDPDEAVDLVVERLLSLQVDEGLPIYVVPVQPPERAARTMQRSGRGAHAQALLPGAVR